MCILIDAIGVVFYGLIILSLVVFLFATVGMKRSYSAEILVPANAEEGMASVDDGRPSRFDGANYHGRVATGERFDRLVLAVAHRTLPLRSCIMIVKGRRSVQATIKDRGPCLSAHCQRTAPNRVRSRKLDLWPIVARRIGCDGLCKVHFWPVPCGAAT